MLRFTDLLLISLTIIVSLAVLVPLTGGLVRFRANYNPKALRLNDPEDGVQAHTGPIISTFVGMIRRVYRIEGIAGLYKGLMPTLISVVVITIFVWIFFDPTNARHGGYVAPTTGPWGILSYSLFQMLISLPVVIITYRAITTPHKLMYFQPRHALRVLLTPTERRRPWILYLTPGLLAAQISHITIAILGLRTLRHYILPGLPDSRFPLAASFPRLSIYFVVVIISTLVLTPLEVIKTRLAIQRNHNVAEFDSVAQEEDSEFAGDEDVIGLRNEEDPYLGLVDCAKRIVDEEGWKALYRAWWLTMLGALGGAFS